MPPRKPRLLLELDETGPAPPAGPLAPGPRPEEMRAAASAAARQALAAGVTTMLADDAPPAASGAGGGGDGFRAPLPRLRKPAAAPGSPAGSPTGSAGDNPLASLLGYSDDGDSPRAAKVQAASAGAEQAGAAPTSQAGAGTEAAAAAAAAGGQHPRGDALDAQLADFLSELESSGLLADEEGGKQEGGGAGAAAAGSDSQQQQQQQQQEASQQEGGSGAGSAGGGRAEQRVLGTVEGTAIEGWFLVLDTASGRQYFWHRSSNEVAWTAPEGAVLPAATAAAAAAARAGGQAAAAAAATAGSDPGAAEGGSKQQHEGGSPAAAAAADTADRSTPEQHPGGLQALAAAFLVAPSAAVLEAAERVAEECTEAAGEQLDAVPKVVRLAVEAQALSALLLLLAQTQHAAVDAADAAAAFKWTDFEGTMQMALTALQGQLHALGLPGQAAAGGAAAEDAVAEPAAGAGMAEADAAGPAAGAGGQRPGSASGDSSGEEEEEEEGELAAEPPPRPVFAGSDQPLAVAAAELSPPLPGQAEEHAAALSVQPPVPPLPADLPPVPAAFPPAGAAAAPPLPGVETAAAAAERRKRKAAGEAAAGAGAGSKKAKAAAGSGAPGGRLGKGAASLINKWQAVAKQVAQEEEEEAAAAEALEDPEARAAAQAAQRQREAEEWRLQQLRTGAADENANFAPVVGDWRERVKQTQKSSSKRARQAAAAEAAGDGAAAAAANGEHAEPGAGGTAAAAAGTGRGSSGGGKGEMPDLDALSEGLPPGWRAMWDKSHARVYFGNLETQVTMWDRPQ